MTIEQKSKRSPNEEQKKAIFHNGGKLLSAGAGSGKTFVLIEHLIFLLGQIKDKNSSNDWNLSISSQLSKIVLMTFTKKAAGEMSVRMMRRVEELLDDSPEDSFWILVRQNLAALNITTIHGFCHRLLRMGFWSNFPQDINLVSAVEHKYKIQRLFDKWFKENSSNLNPLFLAGSQSLLSAMVEIFSSPELRVLWMNPKVVTSANAEIDLFFNQQLEVKGYKNLFLENIDLSAAEKEKTKKWYELLNDFNTVQVKYGLIDSSNFEYYNQFFKSIPRFPVTNSKEINEIQKETLMQIRELKDDLKNFSEDLNALSDNFEVYQNWVETISSLFKYIDSHYFEVDGFSFSDLEYYVLLGLKDESARNKVQESFSYFIVDEFQDTSFIQFEILKKLIGDNEEKLFCVGDRKQAIYGFRGGELQVFSECARLLGQENNYFLKNNFRSEKSIIEFNNNLFEIVFPLGLKFEGHDPHSVEMEAQNVPTSNGDAGQVLSLRTEIVGNDTDWDLDYLESLKIAEHIKILIDDDAYQSICILYRKLRPSSLLLEHLLSSNIAFSAQIKIQFADDPIINLFLYLVELQLNKNDLEKRKSTIKLIRTLLLILGRSSFDENELDTFFSDQKILGLRLAFHKFIFSMGFTNSFYMQNSELVDAVCKLSSEDPAMIYQILKQDEEENYACDMMSGEAGNGKKRIVIMSAHASKGLEFDAVILGGVHTNGRYNGMKEHIGKFPHSFKWKKSFDQRKFFKSPFYHLESEILSLKDFSESKRLLYVACTRAVKHLAFVDLWSKVKDAPKDLYHYDNSWIQALRLITPAQIESQLDAVKENRFEISLLQKDPLGVLAHNRENSLGLISELSVTRLASIADCPFKFYLQNICKIEPSEKIVGFSEKVEDGEEIFYSSKKRGTEVHSFLSKLFLDEIELDAVPVKEKAKIEWAYKLADQFRLKSEVISEHMIKFSFFGQMISGTPDLVFINPDEKIVVWDFKTGIRSAEVEDSYWFQLMSYALAYSQIKQLTQDKRVELSLLYLDQMNVVTKTFTMNEITQSLFSSWKKTESLNQVNPLHCPHCDYSNICRKGQS